MPNSLEDIRNSFNQLTTGQKLRLVVAALATLGLVWGMVQYATRIRYDALFTGLSADDAAGVVASLREQNVPYRLSSGGRVIEVPVEQIDELRMGLAGEGIPRGGGVGFEIFDKPAFGLSDFVQNVNYQRALERELGRTIQSLDSVESARVHLALPPESVFADEKQEASASVVVRLKGAGSLPADRVRAVAHLVASGVEGLDPARVSVVDSNGRMLLDGESDDNDQSLSATQLDAKQTMEKRIESILVAILEPVVGPGKARARATVQLETSRVERVEERYDPNGAVVRSEQKSKMRNEGSATGGVPGTESNLPGGTNVGSASGGKQDSQTSTTNFEINKTISTIAEPRGTLLRQSVAVVIDHGSSATQDANGNEARESVPRSDEEMRKIRDLVRAAVGIDETRGDVLTVENIPFDETLAPGAQVEQGLDWVHLTIQIVRYGALPLAALLIALLVVRPGIAVLRSLRGATGSPQGAPTIAQLQASLGRGELATAEGGGRLRRRLIEATAEDPEAAALVLRGWLGPRSGE